MDLVIRSQVETTNFSATKLSQVWHCQVEDEWFVSKFLSEKPP
jgi:hypothetical protein